MKQVTARLIALLVLALAPPRPSDGSGGFGFVFEQRGVVSAEAIRSILPSPDSRHYVVVTGRRAVLVGLDEEGTPRELGAVEAAARIRAAALSPDGDRLALADGSGTVTIRELPSLDPIAIRRGAHRGEATALAFTIDGHYLVTGGEEGDLRVWSSDGEFFARLGGTFEHRGEIALIASVPPGRRVVSIGRDRQIVLWEIDTQRALRPTKLDMNVLSAVLGDDGKTLVLGLQRLTGNRFRSASAGSLAHSIRADDRLRLIDAGTGTPIRELEGERQDLDAVAVTPDGRFAAAAGGGGSATIWETATGERTTTIPFDSPVTALAFSPDGKRMLAGTERGGLTTLALSGVSPAPRPVREQTILIVIVEPGGLVDARDGQPPPVLDADTRSLRIRGKIKSPAELRSLLVDGHEVTSLVLDEGGDYSFSAAVALPRPGRRQIEILAEDVRGAVARRTFLVDRAEVPRPPDLGARRRIALIVGISSYSDPSIDLRYAHADARALYDLLTDSSLGPAAFRPEDVMLLVDDEATVANINKGLRDFLRQARENDFVLFFFAGHGAPDPNRIQDLYLLAHDTDPVNIAGTGLLMRHVRESIAEIPARDVLILTDSCHAAGIAAPASMRSLLANPIHQTFLEKMHHSSGGLAILTASEAAQVSYENEKWGRHGVFTHFLLDGLRGSADVNGDRIVTLGELMEQVRAGVREATQSRQIPAIGPTSFDRELPLVIVGAPNP